ncbi:MAG: hypothetical protein AAF525_16130 [Pseudomonadota bacterium]
MQPTYAIVFSGELVEGFQPISVKAHMAKMLKADADKMAKLFSGKPVVLKRTADKKEAAKYGSALKKIGADVKVKIVKTPVSESTPTQPATTSQPVERTSNIQNDANFSLRPNDGDIFDPEPETASPALDLSSFELAPDDDSFLVEPTEETVVSLDLSSYEVAEADDTPLAEPTPEVARVEAPEFGIDEPGAVLETLQEEKELLNPDTSGMTLAITGTDLLDPQDQKQDDTPPPDTSNIHLVPNFD